MKILIAEDEFISRALLTELLASYGVCHVAADGLEALTAFKDGLVKGEGYDLICLDIMMPKMDGQEVLAEIRRVEQERGIAAADRSKVMMTTVLDDSGNIMDAFTKGQCEAYLTKPISKVKLHDQLLELGLVQK